jgi:glutathione S-transferase
MILIGRYLSPFVRRVAATMQWVGLPYEHQSLSPADDIEQLRVYNPMLKVPALVLDDGDILVESSAIIDTLLEGVKNQTLLPAHGLARRQVLQQSGIMTSALDKTVSALYERVRRPEEKVHQPYLDRLLAQAKAGFDQIEAQVAAGRFGGVAQPTLADLTAAVGFTFAQKMMPNVCSEQAQPELAKLAQAFEQTEAFKACRFKT